MLTAQKSLKATSPRLKSSKIKLDIFGRDIYVLIPATKSGLTPFDIKEFFNKLGPNDLNTKDISSDSFAITGGTLIKNTQWQIFIAFLKPIKTPLDTYTIGTIAHEAFHAARMIGEIVGLQLSDESEEAYAYMISYITEKILNLLT